MHVHCARMHLAVGGGLVDRPEDTAGAPINDRHRCRGPTQRDVIGGVVISCPEPTRRSTTKDSGPHESLDDRGR